MLEYQIFHSLPENMKLNESYVPPLEERLGAGISYFLFSLIGTIANILVAYAMWKHKRFFLRYPFYVFTGHLIFASLGILLGQFVVTIPLSLTGRPLYGNGALMITLASCDTFFFLAIFFISLFISANRFCFLFSSHLHKIFFENYRLHITCLIPWILGAFWVLNTTLIGCPKVFRHDMFYYTYRCPEIFTSTYQEIFMSVTSHLGYIGPAIMMIFYIGVIIYVRSNASCSYVWELNILIQALLICSAFEVETLLFTFLPSFTVDWGIYWVSLLLDYALIFNASINPIIMIALNPKIKATVFNLIHKADSSEEGITNLKIYEVSTMDMKRIYSVNDISDFTSIESVYHL